jgi:hypothetical protein
MKEVIKLMSKANRHLGSSLDDFLRQEGLLDQARAAAIKEAIAFQVQKAMEARGTSPKTRAAPNYPRAVSVNN